MRAACVGALAVFPGAQPAWLAAGPKLGDSRDGGTGVSLPSGEKIAFLSFEIIFLGVLCFLSFFLTSLVFFVFLVFLVFFSAFFLVFMVFLV